jgi:GntR family transcriptional regulator, N-acetylglucosamine utilization regulator
MTTEMLYQMLRARVQDGTYPVNEPMPTEVALQAEFKAARGTVRAALQKLADDGLVFLGEGRKRYVQRASSLRTAANKIRIASRSPTLDDYIESLPGKPRDELIRSPAVIPCQSVAQEPRFEAADVAEELQISGDAPVYWLERLRLADDKPLSLQWAVIPLQVLDREKSPRDYMRPGGLTQFYKEQNLERTRVVRACRATRATKGEGDFLRVGPGAPLLEEHRVSFCIKNGKERPFEYLLAVYTEGVTLLFEWFEQIQREAGKYEYHR